MSIVDLKQKLQPVTLFTGQWGDVPLKTLTSAGHGQIDFESIFGELYAIGYRGPLSVEWEDSRMEREWGAADACAYVRRNHFPPSAMSLDAALGNR